MFYNGSKFYSTNNYIVSHSCDCFLYAACKWFQSSKEDINSKKGTAFSCKLQVQWDTMELKKYWIKTLLPSHLAYKGPHQLAATWCNISSFSSNWPHWSSTGGWKRSVLFFPWNIFPLHSVAVSGLPLEAQVGCALWGGLAPFCAARQHHRNTQTNETWRDFNISRWLSPLQFILLQLYCISIISQPLVCTA